MYYGYSYGSKLTVKATVKTSEQGVKYAQI